MQPSNSTGYFSNSTGSSVTHCRFSLWRGGQSWAGRAGREFGQQATPRNWGAPSAEARRPPHPADPPSLPPSRPLNRAGRWGVGFQWLGTPPRNSFSLPTSFPSLLYWVTLAGSNTKFVKAYDARLWSSLRHLPLNFTARISHRQSLQPRRLTFRHTCAEFCLIIFFPKRISEDMSGSMSS